MSKAIAVVVLTWLSQPNDAEKLFNSMAEKLTRADTLQVVFSTKMEGVKKGNLKGDLTLATGNKAYTVLSGELDGIVLKLAAISDGVNQRTIEEGKEPGMRAVPKEFNNTITAALERSGMVVALLMRIDDDKPKVRETLAVSG